MTVKHTCTQIEWDSFPLRLGYSNAYMVGWRPRVIDSTDDHVYQSKGTSFSHPRNTVLDQWCNGRGWCDHAGVVRVVRA